MIRARFNVTIGAVVFARARYPEEANPMARQKNPFLESTGHPADGAWGAKRRLVTAMRRINELVITSDADEAPMVALAERFEELVADFEQHPHNVGIRGYGEAAVSGDVSASFDQSPLMGLSNPVSPPLRLEADGDLIRGTVTFGSPFEGPPGHVHGGLVAALFDEALGAAQCLTEKPGMTGVLTVRYRAPTPLHVELRVEAKVDEIKGRKIFASGRLWAGDRLTAEAEGLFISLEEHHFQALVEPGRE